MWRRTIPVSSLAAYAADPEAFCRAAAVAGHGRPRAIALGLLGLAAMAAALVLAGRLPWPGLLHDGPLAALLSLVHRS